MILPKQFFGFVGNEKMILVNHGFSVQVLYHNRRYKFDTTVITSDITPVKLSLDSNYDFTIWIMDDQF